MPLFCSPFHVSVGFSLQPFCSLHLQLQLSENPYLSGTISTKSSAPGIIVATGTTYTSLTNDYLDYLAFKNPSVYEPGGVLFQEASTPSGRALPDHPLCHGLCVSQKTALWTSWVLTWKSCTFTFALSAPPRHIWHTMDKMGKMSKYTCESFVILCLNSRYPLLTQPKQLCSEEASTVHLQICSSSVYFEIFACECRYQKCSLFIDTESVSLVQIVYLLSTSLFQHSDSPRLELVRRGSHKHVGHNPNQTHSNNQRFCLSKGPLWYAKQKQMPSCTMKFFLLPSSMNVIK